MDIIAEAKKALEAIRELVGDARRDAFKELPDAVQKAYIKLQRDEMFAPEKADHSKAKEHLSPSGKYKLVVTPFETKPGCWSYSQGLVYAVGSDTPLFEVRRNYHSFPKTWVEDHPNGHAYLICGEDYQGQTVLELDTGNRKDFLPKSAEKGFGFCWVGHTFNAKHQMLVIDGCYWACPYEYKFFDFSDPMGIGWPEIEPEKYIDSDDRNPVFNDDGTITCFQSEYVEYEEDEDDADDEKREKKDSCLASTLTFRRDGLKLVLVNEWISEKEKKTREEREKAQKAYDLWVKNFRANDPLYLAMLENLKDARFNPDSHDSVGTCYDNWCPDFSVRESRWCRRIAQRKDGQPYTMDLEWACDTGPVKLGIYKDGNTLETKFFMEHSVESMNAAFAYAKTLIPGA